MRTTHYSLRLLTFLLMSVAAQAGHPRYLKIGSISGESKTAGGPGGVIQLEWTGDLNERYHVQSTTNLTAPDWTTLDVVRTDPATASIRWTAPEALSGPRFYRLAGPDAEIFSVEPAIAPPDAAVTLYLTGQSFSTNDVVRVDGAVIPGASVLSSALIEVEAPPQPPGPHRVELVRDGIVLSFFDVFFGDANTAPEEVLQGPPNEPPASPSYRWRGHVTVLKLHEEGSPTDSRSAFSGNGVSASNQFSQGTSGSSHRGHRTVLKSHGGGIDNDCGGMAVDLATGEVRVQQADLVIPGRGQDFNVVRTYISRAGSVLPFDDTDGKRWTFSYDVSVTQTSDGVAVADGTGRRDVYHPDTNGVYSRAEFFNEGRLSNDVFTLTFPDTGRWVFNPFDPANPDGAKLAQIVDRNGNTMSLGYDSLGRLAQIVDDLGRTNILAYNSDGQLASVTDFSGRAVTYQYYGLSETGGSAGDLKSVTSPSVTGTSNGNDFPDGKTTTYTYSTGYADDAENHLLLSVIDGKGQTTHRYVYQHDETAFDFLRCLSAQEGTNPPVQFTYLPVTPTPANQFRTLTVIGNDPVGNVSECSYDARHRPVALREFTGRATPGVPVTDTVNRPINPLRLDDPTFFETRWEWNRDSLCTAWHSSQTNRIEWVYQSDFDPGTAPRFRANLRVERCIAGGDMDGDGRNDDAVSNFEHDPRFGSGRCATHIGGNPQTLGYVEASKSNISRRAARHGRNPQTGRSLVRSASSVPTVANLAIMSAQGKKVVRFKAGSQLAETVKSRVTGSGSGKEVDTAWESVSIGDDDGDGFVTGGIGLGGEACDDGNSDAFITRITDPRGNVTTAGYDAKGNRIKVREHQFTATGRFTDLSSSDFTYNPHGQLTAITNAPDADGRRRVDAFSYYSSGPQAGYLQSIAIDESSARFTTTYEYDARGNLTRCVDPRGTPTDFEVNTLNQTVARQTQGATSAERTRSEFHYDANNNLVRLEVENRDGNGTLNPTNAWFTTLYEYDGLNHLARLMEEAGISYSYLTNEFAYDGNGQLVLTRSPLAVQGGDPFHVTQCAYDELGQLFRVTRAPGSPAQATTQFDYDGNGNLRATRSGLEDATGPRVTEYAYDGLDRRVRMTDAMGNERHYKYDLKGNVTRVTDYGETNDVPGNAGNRRLGETRCQYDGLDRLVQYRRAFFDVFTGLPIGDGFQDHTIEYAPNGCVIRTTNDRGHGTTFTFDTTMFLTAVADAKSNRVEYTYDANGNVLTAMQVGRNDLGGPAETLARGFAYDALDRCVADWDNAGNTNRYAYDSRGNPVRHIDPRGFLLQGDYDSISRPTSNRRGEPGGIESSTRYTYDAASRLIAVADGNSNSTRYAYDSLDRLVRTTLADGTGQTSEFDVHGNLVRTVDANGTQIFLVYDALDRCVLKNIKAGPGVAASTTQESYAYDGLDRCVRAANNETEVTRAYDSLGRCMTEGTESPRLGFDYQKIEWAYDAHGLTLAQTNPSGRAVEYAYDSLDRPVSFSTRAGLGLPSQPLGGIAYIGPCDASRITRPNGVQTDFTHSGLAGVPNPSGDFGWGQIQRIRHAAGDSTSVIEERVFAYDRSQNKIMRALTAPFAPGTQTNRQDFQYDALDRLTQSVTTTNGAPARDATYLLDSMGNRQLTVSGGMAAPYLMDNTLPKPADFQVNQYTITPFDARQYDENGNLQSVATGDPADPGRVLVYDYADRLVTVQGEDGPVADYAYDALGRRMAKVLYGGMPSVPVATNRYLYAGSQVVEERDGGGAVLRTFVLPHVLERSRVMISGAGEIAYEHCDDQGNLLALTDDEGHVMERYDYDDYGTPAFLTWDGLPATGADGLPLRSSAAGNPYLFHGMEWDNETGLYYASAYVDPTTGSELSRTYAFPHVFDQKGRAFAGNNPWSREKEEGGRHTPFQNRLVGGMLPGGAVISAAVSSVGTLAGSGGGAAAAAYAATGRIGFGGGGWSGGLPGTRAQDHNSSRSNKTASIITKGGDPSEIKVKFVVKM